MKVIQEPKNPVDLVPWLATKQVQCSSCTAVLVPDLCDLTIHKVKAEDYRGEEYTDTQIRYTCPVSYCRQVNRYHALDSRQKHALIRAIQLEKQRQNEKGQT